jgi:hypothetical protein
MNKGKKELNTKIKDDAKARHKKTKVFYGDKESHYISSL